MTPTLLWAPKLEPDLWMQFRIKLRTFFLLFSGSYSSLKNAIGVFNALSPDQIYMCCCSLFILLIVILFRKYYWRNSRILFGQLIVRRKYFWNSIVPTVPQIASTIPIPAVPLTLPLHTRFETTPTHPHFTLHPHCFFLPNTQTDKF